MSKTVPHEEAEELVELSLEGRGPLSHQGKSSFKKLCDEAMASVEVFLTKIKHARQYQVKVLTMVRTKCLTRRSARSHRSKSNAKSAASNSNNADGGDPEPDPSVFPRTELKPTFSFYTEFTNGLLLEDA